MEVLASKFVGLALTCLALLSPFSVHAEDLANIKHSGEFKFAMSGVYPPFSSVNEKNELLGFDVDIGTEIAKRMGVKGVAVSNAWDGILASLLSNKYDAVIGSMTITPEREKVVDFVGPYYRSGRGVFVAGNSAIQSLADIKGKPVGVILGETHEKWAREQAGWDVHTYKGLPELLIDAKAGRVQAFVLDRVAAAVAIKNSGDGFKQLSVPSLEDETSKSAGAWIGIAIRKNNPELKVAMQHALDQMMSDGTYTRISMKWIGRDIR